MTKAEKQQLKEFAEWLQDRSKHLDSKIGQSDGLTNARIFGRALELKYIQEQFKKLFK